MCSCLLEKSLYRHSISTHSTRFSNYLLYFCSPPSSSDLKSRRGHHPRQFPRNAIEVSGVVKIAETDIMWVVYALHIQVAGSVATSVFSSFVLVVLLTVHELVCYEIECEKNVKRYQMKTIVSFLLLSLVFPVDVFSEPPPYFDSKPLDNNSYVNVHLVGGHDSGNNSVQCRTDLGTCCSIRQGNYRADWYFPNGTKLNFMESGDDIFESRGAQRVDLRRRENAVSLTGGMYRCDIPTARNGHRSIYVGLYPSSGGKLLTGKQR